MDMVFGRGVKFFHFLIPKPSKLPLKLSSFTCARLKVTASRQFLCLEKAQRSLYQSNHFSILSNQYVKTFEYNHYPHEVNVIQRSASSKSDSNKTEPTNSQCYDPPLSPKLTIFQKMKKMTKDYWHILIPVHIFTSLGWVAVFYLSIKNGVDIVKFLEFCNMSDRYLDMIRGSNAGHWAVTYALYKIFTPLRYTVTVGGTTMCIRYLNKWGYLKFKRDPKLAQSLKCAEEHKATYQKCESNKKSQSPKT